MKGKLLVIPWKGKFKLEYHYRNRVDKLGIYSSDLIETAKADAERIYKGLFVLNLRKRFTLYLAKRKR